MLHVWICTQQPFPQFTSSHQTETAASATARRQNIAEERSHNSKKRNAMKVSDKNTHTTGNRCAVGVTIRASFLFEIWFEKIRLAPKHSLYSTTTPSTSLYAAMTGSCHYVINQNGYRGALSAFALAGTKTIILNIFQSNFGVLSVKA